MRKKQTVDLGSGRSLYVHQEGAGPDLVLIHGAMTTSHDWLASPVFEALTKSHRVSVVDRPGHGRSRRRRFCTPREQADQIADGLGELGIRQAAVTAHSYGGLVALAMARAPSWWRSGSRCAAGIPERGLVDHSMLAPAIPFCGPQFAQLRNYPLAAMVDLLLM